MLWLLLLGFVFICKDFFNVQNYFLFNLIPVFSHAEQNWVMDLVQWSSNYFIMVLSICNLSISCLSCHNRVYDDEEEWFRSIFANSKKEDAIQNQYEFFAQRMGGPPLYNQRRGEQSWFFLFCFHICGPKILFGASYHIC